jgi:hypothetical protein
MVVGKLAQELQFASEKPQDHVDSINILNHVAPQVGEHIMP